jgi:RNA polymerase sigma-B factor
MQHTDGRTDVLTAVLATRARANELVNVATAAVYRASALCTSLEKARRRRQANHERMQRARRAETDRLVETHRHLADRLAGQFANRGQPLEDLQQVAYLGLVTAAKRFDPSRGILFATFARATVVGELKKYFRDHSWQVRVPRPVQELYLSLRPAVEDLSQSLGRAPTPAELAAHLGAGIEDVVEAMEAANALHVDSLDRPRLGDDDDLALDRGDIDPGFVRVEDRSWLVPALAALPPRERRILELRFVEGLPQSAIAAKVGLSQMHVSRLLSKSLAILRASAPVA